ncbi:hypothetical protein KIL84_008977 [Mauremys mutica]|uniref:Uncharacterized protein n=1 Tax=Mauremys mutica TaxID=74926 RepID=A0A9D3XIE0_9SAUR|nr:hypothetical protein KIL84_008977 [Mauremys mutica]
MSYGTENNSNTGQGIRFSHNAPGQEHSTSTTVCFMEHWQGSADGKLRPMLGTQRSSTSVLQDVFPGYHSQCVIIVLPTQAVLLPNRTLYPSWSEGKSHVSALTRTPGTDTPPQVSRQLSGAVGVVIFTSIAPPSSRASLQGSSPLEPSVGQLPLCSQEHLIQSPSWDRQSI